MSLRGRNFFDKLQHHWLKSSRFALPCPPYNNVDYWNELYKKAECDDVHEWGHFDLQSGLLDFRYEKVLHYHGAKGEQQRDAEEEGVVHTTTFAECLGISRLSTPEEAIDKYDELQIEDENEAVLVLGCGNSKVGEQLLKESFVGPVLQVDVSPKLIQLMEQRYKKYLELASVKRMELIVDDARGLTALSHDTVGGGVLDKGLIDSFHLSDPEVLSMEDTNGVIGRNGREQHGSDSDIRQIVNSVHRVLKPSRPFVFFSRSDFDYMLRRTLGTVQWTAEVRSDWKDIQVLKLVDLELYLYRFVKADATENVEKKVKIDPRSKKRRKQR